MNLKEQNILLFTRTMKLGGTENVVLMLCEILKPHVNKIVVCSCGGVNVGKLDNMGIKHYQIPDIESKSPQTLFATIKELKNIVKKEDITVIHTHHRMAAFYVALTKLYKKCAFINTSHNTFTNKRALTRFAYKHADLVACGEAVKRNLVEFFSLSENKVSVVHNAVMPFDGNLIPVPELEKLKNEGKSLIGNIGRLSKQKGMDYFIKAIPSIIKEYPNAYFVIVGNGEEENNLKRLTEELNVKDYVWFMGYRSDVQNVISQLDLIVLSSLWEGLPLLPIEAFSVGKTVVATAVDGTPEIVKDGENGLLMEIKNSEEIAEKVKILLKQPSLKKCLEEKSMQTYKEKFSFEKFSSSYVSYYEQI